MKVAEHLEQYIGKIAKGVEIENRRYNLTISLYNNIPFEGIRTYTTLGLNRYLIDYYFEFIFVCMSKFDENEIASFLNSFAEYLIDCKKGIKQGDIETFNFTMTSETEMNSLYFTLPFYFDDDLQELKLEDRYIIFPLIIPIYDEEAHLIRDKGWNSFEEFLEENEIDNLWDLNREKYSW